MQVQYRETRGGYECIHLPSIDLSALTEAQTQRYQHQHQRAVGSEGSTRRTIVRKASKLTFSGNKGKEKEHDATTDKDKEKDVAGRPSATSATASSGSSSFFNVPSPPAALNANERPPSAAGLDPAPPPPLSGSNPSLIQGEQQPRLPAKPKILPPIPRDFAIQPTKETSRPAFGEVDKDVFDACGQNGLSVRFEINIVKVRVISSCSAKLIVIWLVYCRCLGYRYMAYNFDE